MEAPPTEVLAPSSVCLKRSCFTSKKHEYWPLLEGQRDPQGHPANWQSWDWHPGALSVPSVHCWAVLACDLT